MSRTLELSDLKSDLVQWMKRCQKLEALTADLLEPLAAIGEYLEAGDDKAARMVWINAGVHAVAKARQEGKG